MSRLLVSVRSAGEARDALAGGCDLLDAKEPLAGALAPVSPAVLAEIVAAAGSCPVSAALGELLEAGPLPALPGLQFLKFGLAGWANRDWKARLGELQDPRLVLAAYADHERADAPAPEAVLSVAVEQRRAAFLIDTWQKDGQGLLSWLSPRRLAAIREACRRAGLPLALAGSLSLADIASLRDLAPDWFAVRGAACDGGRAGTVSVQRVTDLARLVHEDVSGGRMLSGPD